MSLPTPSHPPVSARVRVAPTPRSGSAQRPDLHARLDGLSVQSRLLLDALTRAAQTGQPCPSNFALMDALDLSSPDGVRKHMDALRAAGLISVDSSGQRRRVTLRAHGIRTDWSRTSGHVRAGATFSESWDNGVDAILLKLADQGLELATIATRLGRTPSSVRHRLRRLRALRRAREEADGTGSVDSGQSTTPPAESAPPPVTCPSPPVVSRDPGPMRRDLITNDPERPAHECAQIAAFLAAGKGRKVPPAYAGEVRGAEPLAGIAPISPLARRVLMALDNTARPARMLSVRADVDPLLMPEALHELRNAGLVHQGRRRRRGEPAGGLPVFARAPGAAEVLATLGLDPARPPMDRKGGVRRRHVRSPAPTFVAVS